ncbi:hypothetical protein PUV54_06320 [Hyphococcus flavus]|uniref:Secreted protein n=1 Tax=Hyphococcus flavus TaxID=1866326 RepID=A0AAE9ZKG1_9PROT|nr:hypothetical protein [Hyphococcus flavus]WDI32811.1 hypothetical protein PUV54_06320 [Hyphococcus flavus]
MKLKRFLAIAAVSGLAFSPSFAGELADACVAALEADGRDASGCGCLEEEVIARDIVDEMMALGEIEDPAERYEAASDDAKAAMDKCTR